MKANIHPKWFEEAVVICSCGNTYTMGATMPKIEVDVCYSCHPFYTGQMKYVDTAGRVDAFRAKQSSAQSGLINKKAKRELKKQKKLEKELAKPETLAELREQVTKGKKKKASKSK